MSKKKSLNIENTSLLETSEVEKKVVTQPIVTKESNELTVDSNGENSETKKVGKSKRLPRKPLKIDGIETKKVIEVDKKIDIDDKNLASNNPVNSTNSANVGLVSDSIITSQQQVLQNIQDQKNDNEVIINTTAAPMNVVPVSNKNLNNKKWNDRKNRNKNRREEEKLSIDDKVQNEELNTNVQTTVEKIITKNNSDEQDTSKELDFVINSDEILEVSPQVNQQSTEPQKLSKNKRRKKKKTGSSEFKPDVSVNSINIPESNETSAIDSKTNIATETDRPIRDVKNNLIKKSDLIASQTGNKDVVNQNKSENKTHSQNEQKNKSNKNDIKHKKDNPNQQQVSNKTEVRSDKIDTKSHKHTVKVPKKVNLLHYILPATKQLSKSQSENEFLNDFLNKVEDYLKKQAYIEPGGKILIAVSGGVDSIVMMDAIAILANRMRFTFYIAHFNHKLRGLSSDNDEVLVRSTSRDYNVQFYSGSGNVKQYSSKNSLSIEQAARLLRYNFFERTARNLGVDIVSTAHTEDDLVETFFINLFRGSGLTGLSSMPSKRKFVKNVSLVRPFLIFSKKELYEYARIRELKWNEDETNSLLNYTRNKVRHDLIPKLLNEYTPALIEIISRTAELMQGADEVIKDIVAKSLVNVIEEANNERFSFRINMLLTFNKFMQGELIQHAWFKYFRLQPMSLSTIDRILDLTQSQTGSICEISSAYYVLRDRNNLIFVKRIKDLTTSLIIEKPGEYKIGKYKLEITEVKANQVVFNNDKNVEYIPAELMYPFAEIRNKREGDYFHPLGASGEMKLSDFLTNEKVSLIDKPNVLILTNKIDVLWVLGHRISEKCRVKKTEKKIYKLKLTISEKKMLKEQK